MDVVDIAADVRPQGVGDVAAPFPRGAGDEGPCPGQQAADRTDRVVSPTTTRNSQDSLSARANHVSDPGNRPVGLMRVVVVNLETGPIKKPAISNNYIASLLA
jgi:hypothetical protein